MNFLKAVKGAITRKVGARDVTFHPLTLRQCGELVSSHYEAERAKLDRAIKDAALPAAEAVKMYRDLDWRSGRFSFALDWVQTIPGTIATLEKASGEKLGDEIGFDPEALTLALLLWGVEETQTPKVQAAGEAGQSATG